MHLQIMTEEIMVDLSKCDTEKDNQWYREEKQVMITARDNVKDKFNVKQLKKL